jgi:hypothetical protein
MPEMNQFGAAKVKIVENGTVIQDSVSGKSVTVVTDEDAIFHRGALYITSKNWDRVNQCSSSTFTQFSHRSHAL